jgi:hypothetical protein
MLLYLTPIPGATTEPVFDMGHAIVRLLTLGGVYKLPVQELVQTSAGGTVDVITPILDVAVLAH